MESMNFDAIWGKLSEIARKLDGIQNELKTKGNQPNNEIESRQIMREEMQVIVKMFTDKAKQVIEQMVDIYEKKAVMQDTILKVLLEKMSEIILPEAIMKDELKAKFDSLKSMLSEHKRVKICRFYWRKTTVSIVCLSLTLFLSLALNFWQLKDNLDVKRRYDTAIEYINEIKPIK